jgi:hypothetical protein
LWGVFGVRGEFDYDVFHALLGVVPCSIDTYFLALAIIGLQVVKRFLDTLAISTPDGE